MWIVCYCNLNPQAWTSSWYELGEPSLNSCILPAPSLCSAYVPDGRGGAVAGMLEMHRIVVTVRIVCMYVMLIF